MPRKSSADNAPKRVNNNVRKIIGANIKARRLTLGWSQQELSDRFGVSRATVSQYEIGTGEVNAGDLPRLARILDVGLLDFYGTPLPVMPPSSSDIKYENKPVLTGNAEVLLMGETINSVFLHDKDRLIIHSIGSVDDPSQHEAIVTLFGSILDLSADNRETLRRVVAAMESGSGSEPGGPLDISRKVQN